MGKLTNDIYYLIDDYKSNYANNLSLFLNKFNEADEADFIENEINNYLNCIIITEYIDKNYGDVTISYIHDKETNNGYYPTPKEFQILSIEKKAFGYFSQIATQINSYKLGSNEAIFKQKLNFEKIVKFLELKESELDDENIKYKSVFIDKIKGAEELAKSTLEISIKQDFFEIENAKFNEETHKELLKNYYSNTISKYVNTRNLYKASNEQFHFLNKETGNKLTDEDRVDFIAMILTSYLTESNEVDNQFEEADLFEIFNQLKNIEEIVYETKLSELKYNAIKKLVEKIESDKKNPNIIYPLVEDAWEINEEFVEQIRVKYSTSKLIFNCDKDEIEIIPKIQTHDYLKENFNIDENILRYYFEPTRDFITDLDFEKMVKTGYKGDIDRTLKPYIFEIFGAYHARKKIHSQLSFLLFDEKYFINNKEIKFLSDLVPYFVDYSEGFKIGFNDFEKNCITPFLNEYSDKSDFTFKVFEHVTKEITFDRSWFKNETSFSYTFNVNDSLIKYIINAFEDGQKQGHFYKAWSIILGNSKVYAPLFEEYYSNNKVKNKEVITLDENHNDITNDYEKSSIEDYLEQFKDLITNNTYDIFIDAYLQYFTNGKFPSIDKKILFKKMNKKKLGWELKELYKSLKTDNLDIEYFRFAQQNINLFKDEIIEEVNFNKSKFYKTFTTKV